MIKIKDVKHGPGQFEIEGSIIKKQETMKSKWRKHAIAIFEDDTGKIPLNLWREQVDQVNIGDRILLRGAFCKFSKGIKQLSTWEDTIAILKKGKQVPTLEK